ncbi:MAG: sterol transporter periplasmic substrate-binding protein BstB [Candidatus Methylumidiphilus sp.]
MKKTCFTLLAVLLAPIASIAAPDAPIVVCYPGGSVNAKDANAAMGSMLRVVERVGQWQAGSLNSVFTAKADECRKLMDDKNPKFAIASLGIFLEQRDRHHLVPVVQPTINGITTERYRVIVQKGKFNSLEELKGKTLGGTVLDAPGFIGKIVFAGKYHPESFFQLQASNQAIRALRSLDKGEIDAVILNEQQFNGLASLNLTNPIETLFTSEDIPLMGMVADGKNSTAEERTRLGNALAGMCTDAEGKKLCELFGVDSFALVNPATFEPMVKLWKKGK